MLVIKDICDSKQNNENWDMSTSKKVLQENLKLQ